MDFGNAKDTGQVIIGSLIDIPQPKNKRKYRYISKIPTVAEKHDLKKINDRKTGPSCSHAEALMHQNLFINSSLSQLGCDILWQFLNDGLLKQSGLYLNLKNKILNPIPL